MQFLRAEKSKPVHIPGWLVFLLLLLISLPASAQFGRRGLPSFGGGRSGSTGSTDSLRHRTGLEDSITINFRYLDSSRFQQFDSSVKDFTKRFPIPWHHVSLGNFGNATHSLIFSPTMSAGWDHGFHAFDVYNFTVADTRFFQTTRAYSEIGYLLGSLSEQMIQLMHTQNIKPNWNASFQYRLINSPGTFQNQNTSHNNYRLTSWIQSKNKRYQNFFVLVANKLASGENGGIRPNGDYLDSTDFQDDRFKIPVELGTGASLSRNFFSTNIGTGSFYTNATYLMRQQYDFGQRDSIIVNDTTTIQLYYPRLRFEHTISYSTYNYRFKDYDADSTYYDRYYQLTLPQAKDSVFKRDYWRELLNDFSIYQFPDGKNSQQFFKVGAAIQLLKGTFVHGTESNSSYSNVFAHGEYRNKSRNLKWDIEAFGSFYFGGYNSGGYDAHVSLKRLITKKIGYLQVGFENVNRRPSFIFDGASSFYVDEAHSLNKENSTHIYGSMEQPRLRLRLAADYYLIGNYTYLRNYYHVAQTSALFNLLQVTAQKEFKLGRHFNWRTWIIVQEKTGSAELNLPAIITRNQIAFDGNLGFKNLLISFGAEFRYFTPYRAPGYSPLQGQFFFQDTTNIRMRTPELSGFVHFRIRSFVAYIRAENLNTLDLATGSFVRNNVLVPRYPYPGLQIRFGIFWSFVN